MQIDDKDMYTVLDPVRWVAGVADLAVASAESFGRLLRADKAVFVDRGPGGADAVLSPDGVHFLHWPAWAQPHYCRHVRQRDPIRRWLADVQAHRVAEVVRLSDLVPARHLVKTRYYRELMQPGGAGPVMTIAVWQGDAVAAALSLVRGPAQPDFTEQECALAQALAPALGLAYGVAVERAARQGTGGPAPARAVAGLAALTPRERDVATLAAAGHANKDIARRLQTSHWTVKNQLRAVFAKLDVQTRTGLCRRLQG